MIVTPNDNEKLPLIIKVQYVNQLNGEEQNDLPDDLLGEAGAVRAYPCTNFMYWASSLIIY